MVDILIDKTRNNRRLSLHRCHYCDHKKYPFGKTIFPDDRLARKTDKGDYMCGTCVLEMNQNILESMQRRWGGI